MAKQTKTSFGLRVSARLLRKNYNKVEKISHAEMGKLMLTGHKTLPSWNYRLAPLKMQTYFCAAPKATVLACSFHSFWRRPSLALMVLASRIADRPPQTLSIRGTFRG
jgi:DDE family transposase